MKTSFFLTIAVSFSILSANLVAQESGNAVLEERLRNAQVKETKLNNGATFKEFKFAGSMQPNFELGCITMQEVVGLFNPPSLLRAANRCIQEDQFTKAWALFTTGNGFAYYDIKRLADRSTRGARSVLHSHVFNGLTKEQQDKFGSTAKTIAADAEQVASYCAALTKVGPPTYEPDWIVLHGIGAYDEPRNGHYLVGVDAKAVWEEVLSNRCKPIKSS